MDYPFKTDILNHSTSPNKIDFTSFSGSLDKTNEWANIGVCYYDGTINFNQNFLIYLDYKFNSAGANDWNYVFSLANELSRTGSGLIYVCSVSPSGHKADFIDLPVDYQVWHNIIYQYCAKKRKLNGYLDKTLVKTLDIPSFTVTKFAMNFAGSYNSSSSSIKNFKLILGSHTLKSYLYSDVKFEDNLRINQISRK